MVNLCKGDLSFMCVYQHKMIALVVLSCLKKVDGGGVLYRRVEENVTTSNAVGGDSK